MNGKTIVSIVVMTAWSSAWAEPVFMPQAASVVKGHQAEAGVGAHYGYQSSEIIGSAGTTYKNRVWAFPVFARYGVTDTIETRLSVPVVHAVDSSEGLSSTRNDDTGLGNMQLGAKWNFMQGRFPLATALDLDLPTANPANNPGALGMRYSAQLQQGFNMHLQVMGDMPVNEMLSGHASLGYMNTGTYSTTSRTRFNPSELMTFGASVDLSMKRWIENLSLSGEMVGNSAINHSKTNGRNNGNDKGTILEAGPALRYQMGKVRTYAGFLADAGKATFRAYNYRLNFGVSMLFGGQ